MTKLIKDMMKELTTNYVKVTNILDSWRHTSCDDILGINAGMDHPEYIILLMWRWRPPLFHFPFSLSLSLSPSLNYSDAILSAC